MDEGIRGFFIGSVVGFFGCAFFLFNGVSPSNKHFYKKGQLDALHGKWKYKLVTNSVEIVEEVK